MIPADPVGSILYDYVNTGTYGAAGSWIVEGIGEDFIPDNAQMDLVSKAYAISDRESGVSKAPAYCWRRRASSPARRRARCSRRLFATAANRPRRSGPSARLRHRRQIPDQDVQRHVGRRPRLRGPAEIR